MIASLTVDPIDTAYHMPRHHDLDLVESFHSVGHVGHQRSFGYQHIVSAGCCNLWSSWMLGESLRQASVDRYADSQIALRSQP